MRKRPEVYVEFLKAKIEDHLLKWRNLEVDDVPQSSSQAELYAANIQEDCWGYCQGYEFVCIIFNVM